MSVISGSFGLGEAISKRIEVKILERLCAGLHPPEGGNLRMSRQILPAESMFGWYIFVRKRTFGG